jgi:hypothetical protein
MHPLHEPQLPAMQDFVPQLTHAAPLVPHSEAELPPWHVPVESQQPLGHVAAHAPPS